MDFESLDNKIDKTLLLLESCENDMIRVDLNQRLRYLGEKRIKMIDSMMVEAGNQAAAGLITEETASDLLDRLEDQKLDTMEVIYPWFEEGVIASTLSVINSEFQHLTTTALTKLAVDSIGTLMGSGAKKFIAGRLKRYSLIYPDVTEFKQFDSALYDLKEAEEFGIQFKYASKWLEKCSTRVHVELFTYKEKPVMAIAYAKDKKIAGSSYFLEPVIVSSSMNKHKDYYTACMCTKHSFSHPSIKRVLTDLSKKWETKYKKMQKEMEESVGDAYANGTYDKKIELIEESVQNDQIDRSMADLYINELNKIEFSMISSNN